MNSTHSNDQTTKNTQNEHLPLQVFCRPTKKRRPSRFSYWGEQTSASSRAPSVTYPCSVYAIRYSWAHKAATDAAAWGCQSEVILGRYSGLHEVIGA